MDYWEIIGKHLQGEASGQEQRQLSEWLSLSAENEKLLEDASRTWKTTGKLTYHFVPDKQNAWEVINRRIAREEKIIPIHSTQSSAWKWVLRIAAVLVFGLFSTYLYNRFFSETAPQLAVLETQDNIQKITLADGTKVWVNANSIFKYPESFKGEERSVFLQGEAYFEVTENPGKPFTVSGDDLKVEVLGTSFNVNNKGREVTVSVFSGKVRFSDSGKQNLVLAQGETGMLHKKTGSLSKQINKPNALAWKEQKLEFDDTPFPEVRTALENYFDVITEIKSDSIDNCRFTGYFEKPTLQEVLQVLKKTLGIKSKTKAKKVVFSGKGC